MDATATEAARASRKRAPKAQLRALSQADQDIASMRRVVQQASKDPKASLDILVAAGILTRAGNLTKPYR